MITILKNNKDSLRINLSKKSSRKKKMNTKLKDQKVNLSLIRLYLNQKNKRIYRTVERKFRRVAPKAPRRIQWKMPSKIMMIVDQANLINEAQKKALLTSPSQRPVPVNSKRKSMLKRRTKYRQNPQKKLHANLVKNLTSLKSKNQQR